MAAEEEERERVRSAKPKRKELAEALELAKEVRKRAEVAHESERVDAALERTTRVRDSNRRSVLEIRNYGAGKSASVLSVIR
jgi:hypothetical protein